MDVMLVRIYLRLGVMEELQTGKQGKGVGWHKMHLPSIKSYLCLIPPYHQTTASPPSPHPIHSLFFKIPSHNLSYSFYSSTGKPGLRTGLRIRIATISTFASLGNSPPFNSSFRGTIATISTKIPEKVPEVMTLDKRPSGLRQIIDASPFILHLILNNSLISDHLWKAYYSRPLRLC